MKIIKHTNSLEALRAMSDELVKLILKKESQLFNLALSGGETAKQMFSLWAKEYSTAVNWNDVHFFWVDERCVPPDDPESNFGNARQLLFKPLQIPKENIHRIHGEAEPGVEAVRYSWEIKRFLPRFNQHPIFDCIILGVGTDLHTASIFPTTMDLLFDNHTYTVSQHPVTKQFRITMTGPILLNCTPLLVPILGGEKEIVVQKLQKGYSVGNEYPATFILSKAKEVSIYFAASI